MANLITGIRFLFAASLLFCQAFSIPFFVFYLLGGVSDALDGFVARHWGKETKLGARLDTAADIAFFTLAAVKILRAVPVPLWVLVWGACVAAVKVANAVIGFVRYRRFIPEHTVLNKLAGALLFALPLCVGRLPRLPLVILIALSGAIATLAALWEGHLVHTGKEIG